VSNLTVWMRANGLGAILDDIENGEAELKAAIEGPVVTIAATALQSMLTGLVNSYIAELPDGARITTAVDTEIAKFFAWAESKI